MAPPPNGTLGSSPPPERNESAAASAAGLSQRLLPTPSPSASPPPSPPGSPPLKGLGGPNGNSNGNGRSCCVNCSTAALPRPLRRLARRVPCPGRAFLRFAGIFLVFLVVLSWFVSLPATDEVNRPPEKVVTHFKCPVPSDRDSAKPSPGKKKLPFSSDSASSSADAMSFSSSSSPSKARFETVLPLSTVPAMTSNAKPAKYLVLLSEHNERIDFINAFHGSLMSSGAGRDAIVVVFSLDPSPDFINLLSYYRDSHGMRIELRTATLPSGRKLELERFLWYRAAMEEFDEVEMVMLCDYDVVFQRHPFLDYQTPINGISLSTEWASFPIGDCSHHRQWLLCGEPWWGVGTMERLKPYPRICAGMIIGYRAQARELTIMLASEIERTSCNDQGILNYLYYTCLLSHLNVTVHSNEFGLGGTIGSNPHYWVNSFGDLINQRGEIQAWVHQYKWHPAVIDGFMSRWPLPRRFGRFSVTCRTRVWLWCFDDSDKPWPWTDGRGWIALYRWENWMLKNLVRRFSMYRF